MSKKLPRASVKYCLAVIFRSSGPAVRTCRYPNGLVFAYDRVIVLADRDSLPRAEMAAQVKELRDDLSDWDAKTDALPDGAEYFLLEAVVY